MHRAGCTVLVARNLALLSVRHALQGMTFGYKDQNWQEEEGVRVIHAALEVTGH